MTFSKLLVLAGVTGLIGAATPAQATWCWFKCPPTSTGGTSTSGGTSSGGPTSVPEPEQMGIFAMGIAVIGYRLLRGRRGK